MRIYLLSFVTDKSSENDTRSLVSCKNVELFNIRIKAARCKTDSSTAVLPARKPSFEKICANVLNIEYLPVFFWGTTNLLMVWHSYIVFLTYCKIHFFHY